MIYIPQEIVNFTYSNIVTTVPDYSLTTNYLVGQLSRYGNYHYISTYGTVSLPNVGKTPLQNLGLAWLEYEPSNIYACLDPFEETKTTWIANGIIEFERGAKDNLGIGGFKAKQVTIEYRDDVGTILDSQTFTFLPNNQVFDLWTYIYSDFSDSTDEIIYLPLLRKGTRVRVTFSNDGADTNCSFFIAGKAVDMGLTDSGVNFPDKRIGSKTVKVADFTTTVLNSELTRKITAAKRLVDEPMLFIIDPTTSSVHQNMIVLGKITQCSGTGENKAYNTISWQLEQTILE